MKEEYIQYYIKYSMKSTAGILSIFFALIYIRNPSENYENLSIKSIIKTIINCNKFVDISGKSLVTHTCGMYYAESIKLLSVNRCGYITYTPPTLYVHLKSALSSTH